MDESARTKKFDLENTQPPADKHTDPEISIHLQAAVPILKPLGTAPSDRRVATRHDANLETVIFHKGVSFRTKTLNISTTGALLADIIPASYVDQVLEVVFVRQTGQSREFFMFKGKALGSPLRSPRIQFLQMSVESEKKLLSLLNDSE